MSQRIFLVDVEASGKTPASGVMTEYGVVDFETFDWFHGGLWDFTPHPDIPALPVVTAETPNPNFKYNGIDREYVSGPADVMKALVEWLDVVSEPGDRFLFVSDNPGFDFMWMAYEFDRCGIDNPFGHSSRRIGDYAAGLAENWWKTSAWKRLRRTKHDHNPVNDALGNAQALREIFRRQERKG